MGARFGGWEHAREVADLVLPLPKDGGQEMFFRKIPVGRFRMGTRGPERMAQEPEHEVVIEREFFLGTFAVTQEQWRVVAELNPTLADRLEPSSFKGKKRPVENVSWDDCRAWCAGLGGWEGLSDRIEEVRLPSEAEWEYACRGGPRSRDGEYHHGDGEAALAAVGWYGANSGGETHPVDEVVGEQPEEHPLGLFGMHGNVWEWCSDVWDAHAYRKRPEGWAARSWTDQDAGPDRVGRGSAARVLRGGSWLDSAGNCRSAYRGRSVAGFRFGGYGFRVCLVRSPAVRVGGQKSGEAESETPSRRPEGRRGEGRATRKLPRGGVNDESK